MNTAAGTTSASTTSPASSAPGRASGRDGLAAELDALYEALRAEVGAEDLEFIRRVAAYSEAMETRGRELIGTAQTWRELKRGILLRALHVVVEFSELGHNIMHGSYDTIEGVGRFRSDRWIWDFAVDPEQWRRMHHQNHHPETNIVGKDHDLGYTIARLFANQDWFGHHTLQPLLALLLMAPTPLFGIYTASSSARVQGRGGFDRDAMSAPLSILRRWATREYVDAPLASGLRAPVVAAANHVSQALGYATVAAMLIIEHHAPNVAVFADPGPYEDRDAYYERQLRGTTNFNGAEEWLAQVETVLREEIDFDNPPPTVILMGGLDTHLEHHLFPDLPCARQREATDRVRAICERHGLPYNVSPIGEMVPDTLRQLLPLSAPVAPGERPKDLLRTPRRFVRRLVDGLRYRSPDPQRYLRAHRFYNAAGTVLDVRPLAGGDAVWIRIARPRGWDRLDWPPGAFITIQAHVFGTPVMRQYSVLRESAEGGPIEITVRRVPGGQLSPWLCDHLAVGDTLTLVHPPTRHGGLVQTTIPERAVYVAGGVGITPILSMLRRHVRHCPDRPATLIYFNRSKDRSLFLRELEDLERRSAIELDLIFDAGRPGLTRDRLHCVTPTTDVFACAPPGLLTRLRELLDGMAHSPERFHEEHFSAGAPAAQPLTGRTHRVRYARSGVVLEVDEGATLLQAARDAGLELPAGCERGLCQACACARLEGEVATLGRQAPSNGRITLCNSYARGPLVLDA